LAAQLWVSSTTEDMDLFLTLRNIDPDGNDVLEIGQQGQPVPVAKGWLRVSHRELDPELSRPYRPYHKHLRRQWLKPNEIVEVHVEVWPTSMVLKKGHRIRLDIQPRDGIGSAPYTHYHADYNVGENTIYSGGDKDSFLLVPIIPPQGGPLARTRGRFDHGDISQATQAACARIQAGHPFQAGQAGADRSQAREIAGPRSQAHGHRRARPRPRAGSDETDL